MTNKIDELLTKMELVEIELKNCIDRDERRLLQAELDGLSEQLHECQTDGIAYQEWLAGEPGAAYEDGDVLWNRFAAKYGLQQIEERGH